MHSEPLKEWSLREQQPSTRQRMIPIDVYYIPYNYFHILCSCGSFVDIQGTKDIIG
jgi:hypothetical protein